MHNNEDVDEFSYEECEKISGDPVEVTEMITRDIGEPAMCILHKLLYSTKTHISTQRNVIFKTWCTITGKLCDVIIGSGSIKNMVSLTLVKALQL